MATIESLLTLGLAKGIDPTRALQPSTGVRKSSADRIEWGDVRMAIGSLEPRQRAILQIKILPELVTPLELAELESWLMAALISAEYDGKIPGMVRMPHNRAPIKVKEAARARMRRMANAVLAEYCDPKTCPKCHGKAKVAVHQPGIGVIWGGCPKCDGKGYRPWRDSRRIKACQMDKDLNRWRAKHLESYELTLRFCRSQYLAAAQALKAKLFGDDPYAR